MDGLGWKFRRRNRARTRAAYFFLNMVAQTLTYNCTKTEFISSFKADNAISNDFWLLLKVDDCLLGFRAEGSISIYCSLD